MAILNRCYLRLFCTCLCWAACAVVLGQDGDLSAYSGDQEGLELMIQDFLAADLEDRIEMTEELVPTEEEYYQVFTDEKYARKVYRYHKRLARQVDIIIRPLLKDQTDYVCWSATAEELAEYVNGARQFPGGYREMAAYLSPEYTFYRFKFIQPGRKLGSSYDMLVYLNGHWRIFHRPWAVLGRF